MPLSRRQRTGEGGASAPSLLLVTQFLLMRPSVTWSSVLTGLASRKGGYSVTKRVGIGLCRLHRATARSTSSEVYDRASASISRLITRQETQMHADKKDARGWYARTATGLNGGHVGSAASMLIPSYRRASAFPLSLLQAAQAWDWQRNYLASKWGQRPPVRLIARPLSQVDAPAGTRAPD
jgi:hypothetical protein